MATNGYDRSAQVSGGRVGGTGATRTNAAETALHTHRGATEGHIRWRRSSNTLSSSICVIFLNNHLRLAQGGIEFRYERTWGVNRIGGTEFTRGGTVRSLTSLYAYCDGGERTMS